MILTPRLAPVWRTRKVGNISWVSGGFTSRSGLYPGHVRELFGCSTLTATENRMSRRWRISLQIDSRLSPKFNLHSRCHGSWLSVAFGTILRRDSAQPWLLQVGTPSFGSSHCVKTT